MDKLIQLLNEYEEINKSWKIWQFTNKAKKLYRNGWSYDTAEINIISKKFWFIKWLVDNDKIDKSLWNVSIELYHTSYTMYEAILMLLAISDTPIEDLISYLK